MQTREERVEALRTLLPLVEVHLAFMDGSPGAAEYGYSDCEEGAPEKAEPCIGDHCLYCTDRCSGFSWEQLWRGLRKDYPVIPDPGPAGPAHVRRPAGAAVYYTLVQPWDGSTGHRQGGVSEARVAGGRRPTPERSADLTTRALRPRVGGAVEAPRARPRQQRSPHHRPAD